MKYAGIIKNDLSAAPGICLSFFTQGCPNHCPGCHNPDTWDFQGGKEFTDETLNEILTGLKANGIDRKFCIMGGEPLCKENAFLTELVIDAVRNEYPDIKIYIWTGYVLEDLLKIDDKRIKSILRKTNVLIDGPYLQELRDISLKMRGSKNQRIIDLSIVDLK